MKHLVPGLAILVALAFLPTAAEAAPSPAEGWEALLGAPDAPPQATKKKAPAKKAAAPAPQARKKAPAKKKAAGEPLFDFEKWEIEPLLGVAVYSGDFDADPQIALGVKARVPTPGLPWIGSDRLGAFAEIMLSQMDRSTEGLETSKGTVFFGALGGDYALWRDRDKTKYITGQLGLIYSNFGSISDTEAGWALLFGSEGGMRLSNSVWLSFNPQLAYSPDTSDFILFLMLGAQFQF